MSIQAYKVSQWLQILKEPYKSRAIAAVKKLKWLNDKNSSLKEAIEQSFPWFEENESHPASEFIDWGKIAESPKRYVQEKYHHFLK